MPIAEKTYLFCFSKYTYVTHLYRTHLNLVQDFEEKNGEETEHSDQNVAAENEKLSEARFTEPLFHAVNNGRGGQAEEEQEQNRSREVTAGGVRRNSEAQQDDCRDQQER